VAILNIPRKINIYDEDVKSVNFKKLKDFIHSAFGKIKVDIIKKKKIVQTDGLLFDFIGTQRLFNDKQLKNSFPIVLTNKIFATLDENRRPHIRASIYSIPSVISLEGIIQGPAKPKEFYINKQRYVSLGVWDLKEHQLKKKFKDQFIDYQDKRLTEVLKGYIAQALFFYIVGNPFCDKKSCRLFNAHWQKDLIYSQITKGTFCKDHQNVLKKINKR